MSGYLLRRTLRALLTLWVVLTAVFLASRLTGDPTLYLLPDDASDQARSSLLGLNGVLTNDVGGLKAILPPVDRSAAAPV